jgi:hypothetical protein
MVYFIIKCALSGIIIAVVSEIARRSPSFEALIVSLPLVSLLAILWLWRDTGDVERDCQSRAVHVLVCFAVAADVSDSSGDASRRHPLLAQNGSNLRSNRLALYYNGLVTR